MEKTIGHSREEDESIRVSEFSCVETRFAVLSVVVDPTVADLPALTTAERDIVGHVVRGASNRQIADHRHTSERTVANQIAAIFQKLAVGSRAELVIRVQGSLRR